LLALSSPSPALVRRSPPSGEGGCGEGRGGGATSELFPSNSNPDSNSGLRSSGRRKDQNRNSNAAPSAPRFCWGFHSRNPERRVPAAGRGAGQIGQQARQLLAR